MRHYQSVVHPVWPVSTHLSLALLASLAEHRDAAASNVEPPFGPIISAIILTGWKPISVSWLSWAHITSQPLANASRHALARRGASW